MGPNDKFDLRIRNANLIDPSRNLSGKRDIGIRFGQIEAIEASIAPERAQRLMDAGGKLVKPGLIDLRRHTFIDPANRRGCGAVCGYAQQQTRRQGVFEAKG